MIKDALRADVLGRVPGGTTFPAQFSYAHARTPPSLPTYHEGWGLRDYSIFHGMKLVYLLSLQSVHVILHNHKHITIIHDR